MNEQTNEDRLAKTSDQANNTHLLSKVMFMDTMGTLEKANMTNMVQLNPTSISGNSMGGMTGNETLKMTPNTLNNNTQRQVNFSNTESRRDYADLELVYRNLANYTDSGLNTLIKTTTTNE